MNIKDVMHHYEIPGNRGQDNTIAKIAAQVADMTDDAIVSAITKAAAENGITDLYLMDKQFIKEALEEKLARMNNEPLTIEELRQMNGEPVYCPEEKMWGIVKVDQAGRWANMPFLLGQWCGVDCEFDIGQRKLKCYRHKPKEPQP